MSSKETPPLSPSLARLRSFAKPCIGALVGLFSAALSVLIHQTLHPSFPPSGFRFYACEGVRWVLIGTTVFALPAWGSHSGHSIVKGVVVAYTALYLLSLCPVWCFMSAAWCGEGTFGFGAVVTPSVTALASLVGWFRAVLDFESVYFRRETDDPDSDDDEDDDEDDEHTSGDDKPAGGDEALPSWHPPAGSGFKNRKGKCPFAPASR
eukprot:gnl/Spiro4/16761_TR9024_c0_g1_i1.p1 gnl/Spiro4/16761_TR9024_c0_g1~~gnl/Spiro4/16761_TR9024_c0_g1_i1.p1  ORF type:complete len:218 (+),score=37.31 gnl/Spiro4/16761_TR9024_c0_g1_i1:31-654(+)